MRRITTVIILLGFIVSNSFTQWVQISTIGNNDLKAVKFFNEFTGIVAGQGGIWRTTNSGVNWLQVLSGANMNSVSFPDNNIGYAVGDSGKIYKTFDSGLNWLPQTSGIIENLYSVSFFNALTGHAVGQNGKILRTQQGGSNWYQNVNQLSEDLNCVQMITNNSTAIAVGTVTNVERYLSTANGGTNWVYSFSSGGASLKSVFSVTANNILAVGTNGRIRLTTNSGTTWSIVNSNVSTTLNSIFFMDINTGFIFGNTATIIKSTSGGLNWDIQTSSFSNHLYGCSFINQTTGWAVGSSGIVIRMGIPVGLQNNGTELPKSFLLYQNYPNPFNPKTMIRFDINKKGNVKIKLYDSKGSLINELIDKYYEIGNYELEFDGCNYSSGIYIYELLWENSNEIKKMVLLK